MKTLTPELHAQLAELARAIQLLEIRAVEFAAKAKGPAPASPSDVQIKVEWAATPAAIAGGFVVEAVFQLTAHRKTADPPQEPPASFFELRYRAGAVYKLDDGIPSHEVLVAFAETNGMLHLWPYFRAFAQQSSAQLGLPGLLIPPFRPIAYSSTRTVGGTEGTQGSPAEDGQH